MVRPWPLSRATWPIGVITTVPELLRYAEFHMGQGQTRTGERLLSPESLASMQTQQVAIGGSHEAMALTWFINHTGGVRHLSHTGSTLGPGGAAFVRPRTSFRPGYLDQCRPGAAGLPGA